jgi:predicted  nucleic acid-binding Zn-ribbon protein
MANTVSFKIQVSDDGQFKVITGDAAGTLDIIRTIQKQAGQMSQGITGWAKDSASAFTQTASEASSSAKSIQSVYERTMNDIKGAIAEGTTSFKENISLQKKEIRDLEKEYNTLKEARAAAMTASERESISGEMQRVKQELEDARMSLHAFEDAQDSMSTSSSSVRTQLMNLRNEMSQLRLEGKEDTEEYRQRRAELERLGTVYRELQTEQQALSTGATQIGGVINGVQGLMGVYSMGTGIVSMFTQKNEDLMRVQSKMQTVMTIMMGLQQAQNALHSTSAFRITTVRKVTELWQSGVNKLSTAMKVNTATATVWQGVLTGGVTIAITAIIALVGKLIKKHQEEKQAIRDAAEEEQRQLESVRTSAANSVAGQLLEFRKLQKGWATLGNDMAAKTKFISDNETAFRNLGVEVTSVYDAENLLVNNEQAFVQSLKNRALAAAAMELATNKYKEALAKMVEADQVKPTDAQKKQATKDASDAYIGQLAGKDVLGRGQVMGNKQKIMNDAYKASIKKQTGEVAGALREEGKKLMEEGDRFFAAGQAAGMKANQALQAVNITPVTPGGSVTATPGAGDVDENKAVAGSIAEIEGRLSDLRAALKSASADERAAIQQDILVWEAKLDAVNNELAALSVPADPQTLQELSAAISYYEKQLNTAGESERKEIADTINSYKAKRQAILDSIAEVKQETEDAINDLGLEQDIFITLRARVVGAEEAARKIRELQAMSAVAQTQEEVDAINAAIESWKKYTAVETTASKADNKSAQGLSALSSAVGSLAGLVDSSAAGWVTWISNVLSAIAQAIPALASLTIAHEAEATANTAAAATGAASAVASIPYVGPIMAVAAIASIIAAIAAIPKFASGGIAYGPTLGLFGEYANAANDPEVVAPLSKLRDIIGGSGWGTRKVEFKLRGRDLYATMGMEAAMLARG